MSEEEIIRKGIVKYEAPPVDKLPLPLQVLARAAQHFACKAADGADINLSWEPDAEEPHLAAWTRKGRLEVRWRKDDETLTMIFVRNGNGRYFAKRFDIGTDKKTAADVVVATAQMIVTAVETLVVQVHPTLEEFFGVKAHERRG
jgi:hypothetical protein